MNEMCGCVDPTRQLNILSPADAEEIATLLKALAEPMRLRIISIMVDLGGTDVCACEFPDRLGISQPTASHHLKRLTEAGLLTREQRGKWAFFTLVPERLAQIRDLLGAPLLQVQL